jgi:hypothetical protein
MRGGIRTRSPVRRRVVAALLSVVASLPAAAAPWQEVQSAHFRVRFVQDEAAARHVVRVAEALYADAADKFPLRLGRRLDVWLAESPDQLRGVLNAPIQDWAMGYAFPLEGRIVLRNPTGPGRLDELERLTRHEVAHVLLGALAGEGTRSIPLWFHEGFAMYVSEEWTLSHQWTLLGNALFASLLPLDSLAAGFPSEPGRARLAYVESFSAFRTLVRRYSRTQTLTLLARLSEGETFDAAFDRVFGLTPRMFGVEWQESATRGTEWLALLGASLFFWTLAAPLLWWGYRRHRRARAARVREWEERESRPDAFFGTEPDSTKGRQ